MLSDLVQKLCDLNLLEGVLTLWQHNTQISLVAFTKVSRPQVPHHGSLVACLQLRREIPVQVGVQIIIILIVHSGDRVLEHQQCLLLVDF